MPTDVSITDARAITHLSAEEKDTIAELGFGRSFLFL